MGELDEDESEGVELEKLCARTGLLDGRRLEVSTL